MFDFFQVPEVTGNEGGISELYLTPVDWFDTIQEAPSSGVAAGDTAKIATAHTWSVSPAHGALQMILIPDKEGLFKITSEGEAPNQKLKAEFEGALSGLSAVQVEFMKQSRNRRFIAQIKDGNCGNSPKIWNFGCSCRPVILSTEYSTEDNIWKIKGTTMCAPAQYTAAGSIPLEA